MCFFSQRPFLKEPTKQDDETKGVSEVCGLGLCAVYFGYFPIPPFSWIELTPYIYMYVFSILFGAWLALRMPPPSLFSKPSGAESQVFKTESASELFIYIIHTYSCLFIETHCPQEFLRII